MLKEAQVASLAEKVYEILANIGIVIENDEVTKFCLGKGCTQGADSRVKIPRKLIDEMVAFQKKTQDEYERDQKLVYTCGPDWTHHILWNKTQDTFHATNAKHLFMQAFDCGPTTFYDYPNGKVKAVDSNVFATMLKFAQATKEIGYTSMWYRQDLPPEIERIDALRSAMDYTDKFAGIEAIYPEVVKYHKEASEILTGDPKSSAYLAGSECMTMPLILESRSAEDILARKAANVNRYHVASMPTVGVSTPVTLAGSIVMGAAEMLGCMVVCWCVDPESDISGRMITLIADMRNGNSTTFGPEYTRYDNAVRQMFNGLWGGHCMVEVFFSPTARRPGLQAVFENWYGTECRRRWENDPAIPYAGMGTLHNGGLGSPTQFMLDMEIRKAGWAYKDEIVINEDTLNWEEVLKVTETKGNFLMSDHTLMHCRDLWSSDYFLSEDPFAGAWDGTEKAILDRCDAAWRANLEKWAPPTTWTEDQKKEMDKLVARAKKEFGAA